MSDLASKVAAVEMENTHLQHENHKLRLFLYRLYLRHGGELELRIFTEEERNQLARLTPELDVDSRLRFVESA